MAITVKGFPPGPAEDALNAAVSNLDGFYGSQIGIVSASFHGIVTDIAHAVSEMMSHLAIIDEASPGAPFTIAATTDIMGAIAPSRLDELRQTIEFNVAAGDYLVAIRLREVAGGKEVLTVNSIRPDAKTFSGLFFLTTVLPGGFSLGVHRPNTNCQKFVLVNYALTNIPKISLEVCARAVCEGGKCVGCLLTSATGDVGVFADLKVSPEPKDGKPVDGTIAGNCCVVTVSYVWVTGFKSIKVVEVAGKQTFEIEGHFGRSDSGFRSVEECCGVSG